MTHLETITRSLSRLLDRAVDGNPFVVLSDRSSDKFVQFAGSSSQPLVLDLPTPALTPQEFQRAQVLFQELGNQLDEIALRDHSGAETGSRMAVFQVPLGRNARRAAELALRVFTEVYKLPEDFALAVEEE